jgi:V8-like Glu-specific endopeptidase
MMRWKTTSGALAMTLSLISCADDQPGSPGGATGEVVPAFEVTDAKGNVFVRQAKIAMESPPIRPDGRRQFRLPTGNDRDYSLLSDLDLAKELRPKMARDGYEYIRKDLDMDLVREVRQLRGGQLQMAPGLPRGVTSDVIVEELDAKSVIGADGRLLRRDNTTYPYSAQVWNDWGCSGTMIGRSTMVTAAHCVHSGSGFFMWPVYRPGVDIQDANPYPFGEFPCYDITVAGGWDGDTVSADYAVIEFGTRCGSFPGDSTGWLGFYATDSGSNISGKTSYIYGYPGDKSPYPQIWGIGNSSLTTSVWYPARLFYNIDTAGGQSGSGVYQVRDGGRYVVGIHNGNWDSDENQARWLDTTVAAFIRKYSAL